MPLPMIHLTIAVKLIDILPVPRHQPEFLLGSISPDAIHMRANTKHADKQMVHLISPENNYKFAPLKALLKSKQNFPEPLPSFTNGYITHLLIDRLWTEQIIPVLGNRMPHQWTHEECVKVYYEEADQHDFNLYAQAEWMPGVWQQLSEAAAPDFQPYLNADEIFRWRERNLHWFGELKAEPKIIPEYLTEQLVHDFIEQATVHVNEYLSVWLTT